MTCGTAPSAFICASSTFEDWMRIFRPSMSSGVLIGLLADMTLKPLSQKARPTMPLPESLPSRSLPIAPSVTLRSAALSPNTNGRSKISNSLAPNGPNLASEGASICTAPSCSASSSSLSL